MAEKADFWARLEHLNAVARSHIALYLSPNPGAPVADILDTYEYLFWRSGDHSFAGCCALNGMDVARARDALRALKARRTGRAAAPFTVIQGGRHGEAA